MANKDYLVVGLGLAGLSFCKHLLDAQLSFDVIDQKHPNASAVAGGLYNPIVLKRFSPIWLATEQMDYAHSFYKDLENLLYNSFDYRCDVLRRFANEGEIKKWKEVATLPVYQQFMIPEVQPNVYENISAPLGFGQLKKTGRIDTANQISQFTAYLLSNGLLRQERFQYDKIQYSDTNLQYKGNTYRKIVFAEGMNLLQNPYFNYLPIIPNKGQLLKIKCSNLKLQHIIKGPVFIIPLGNDAYLVGSTYERDFENEQPTKEGHNYLSEKLRSLLPLPFDVVEHYSGIRPTVRDRRPLIGSHPKSRNLTVLNGLGSRGVLLGPYMAKALLEHLEKGKDLPEEANINRFDQLYEPE